MTEIYRVQLKVLMVAGPRDEARPEDALPQQLPWRQARHRAVGGHWSLVPKQSVPIVPNI